VQCHLKTLQNIITSGVAVVLKIWTAAQNLTRSNHWPVIGEHIGGFVGVSVHRPTSKTLFADSHIHGDENCMSDMTGSQHTIKWHQTKTVKGTRIYPCSHITTSMSLESAASAGLGLQLPAADALYDIGIKGQLG